MQVQLNDQSSEQKASRVSPLLKNLFALSYTLSAYAIGITLLLASFWLFNLLGVILIVHSLLLATAFTHEFIHDNIFKSKNLNRFWGTVMTHLNGACYSPWDALMRHHINHHVYHVDFIPFDYANFVANLNPVLRNILIALEWAYIPAFELIIRGYVIVAPFRQAGKHHLRSRTLLLMLYRVACFGLLGWLSWRALVLYGVAYVCFVLVMRFVDTFHHTYEYVIQGETAPKFDRVYEQENTFSNIVSIKYPWLNLLYLNFGYHNAHHHNMRCPWHELPALHEKLYGREDGQLASFPQLAMNYHKFRLARLTSGQGETITETATIAEFTGAVGVSFLTPP